MVAISRRNLAGKSALERADDTADDTAPDVSSQLTV